MLQIMYAINAFLISNKQTVNFSQPFPFLSVSRHCSNFPFLVFVLTLYHHSVSGWFSFNATLMHNKRVYACLFMQNGDKKNCTGQVSLWLLFSSFSTISIIVINICLPNISFIYISHQYNGTFLLTY